MTPWNLDDDTLLDALLRESLRQEEPATARAAAVKGDPIAAIERRIATIESGRLHAGEVLLSVVALLGCLAIGAGLLEQLVSSAVVRTSAWPLMLSAIVMVATLDRLVVAATRRRSWHRGRPR
jgi:hypothetical protein